MPEAARRRRTGFGPTVLVGLGGAALAAVAAARDWATASGDGGATRVHAVATGSETAPLAVALALVALAAWGTVLVLSGWVRRAVAVVGALASTGVVVSVVAAFGSARDDATSATVAAGATASSADASLTAWYFACGVGAVLAVAAFVVAVRSAPSWPAMGSRYDNPAVRAEAAPATEQDMWRALDDGRDPTA